MEVNVIIGLDADTKSIAQKFLKILEGSTPIHKTASPEEISDVRMAEVQKEETTEVQKGETTEETVEAPVADYTALRKEIKQLGVKLVQAKKQKEVKALTTRYGYSKIDELPDDKLESYLAELKEI